LGQQRAERGRRAVPRREHGGRVLYLAPQLDEARLGERERRATARALRVRRVHGERNAFLTRLAPRIAPALGVADPRRGVACAARPPPAQHRRLTPPMLPTRVPRSRYTSRWSLMPMRK